MSAIEHARQKLIERGRLEALMAYPRLWNDLASAWRSDSPRDTAWLMYSANYLFRCGNVRWAIDPMTLPHRLQQATFLPVIKSYFNPNEGLARMKTSELLGYPKDARLLILNIDDYGLCFTANDSAIGLLKKGIASSCTVMAPAPWGLHGLFLLKENPEIGCGVHLTAISEHVRYRWRPLSSRERVPTLVDEDGYFLLETRQDQFTRQADVHELEQEFRLQIEFVLKHGISITHLDSHCNVHDSRNDIFEMTVRLAKEYGLALRVHNEKYMPRLRKERLPALDYPDLDSFRLPVKGKSQIYLNLLKELPEGLSEWAIHPAYESAELRAITPEWPVRASDDAFFNSDEFRLAMQTEGIILASYRLLQPFWKQ